MPDDIGGLPPGLRKRLDDAIPEPLPESSEKRQWSLSDIDQLILEVQGTAVAVPEPEEVLYAPVQPPLEPVPEPLPVQETKVMPKVQPKLAPQPAPIPAPQPEPKTAPLPPVKTKPVPKPVSKPEPKPKSEPKPEPKIELTDKPKPQPEPEPIPETKAVWDEPIEKPGVLLRRVDMQMTSDLSPVPKVVPAEDLIVRQPPVAEELDIPEGQQRFAYFDEQAPEQPMEELDIKARLEKSRIERTAQFQTLRSLSARMEQSGETGTLPPPPEEDSSVPEYRDPSQRDAMFQLLQKLRGRRATAAIALGVFALLAMGLQLFSLFSSKLPVDSPGFLGPMTLFFAAGLLVSGEDLLGGITALFRGKPNANTVLLLAALVSAAQNVLLFVYMNEIAQGAHRVAVCMPLFLFSAAFSAAARWQQARQRCDNFRFCAYNAADHLYAVCPLDPRDSAKTARQHALPGRSKTVLPVPVRFPAGFLRQSLREDAIDQSGRQLLPIALGLAVLAGLVAALRQGTALSIVSAAAVAASLCIPYAPLLLLAQTMLRLTKFSRENGVAILNTDAALECSNAGAFVLDSVDLYLPSKGRMHGWREYWQVRTDEVLLYAAGIAIAAGGPLQAVFEGVVEGDYSVLPAVRDLAYEDRMGLSCWIHNQKVFFGNRSLLENHGVTVALSEKDEKAYEHDGRRIIYLAVEKRLTAFFVVSYCPDTAMAPIFKQLEAQGTQALICNSDPCVSADFLTGAFELEQGSLTLLRAAPSQACRKQMRTPQDTLEAGVYHTNNARAFLRALSACVSLESGIKRLRLFHLVGVFMMFLLLLIFILTSQLHFANSLIFIAVELIWATIMYTVMRN